MPGRPTFPAGLIVFQKSHQISAGSLQPQFLWAHSEDPQGPPTLILSAGFASLRAPVCRYFETGLVESRRSCRCKDLRPTCFSQRFSCWPL